MLFFPFIIIMNMPEQTGRDVARGPIPAGVPAGAEVLPEKQAKLLALDGEVTRLKAGWQDKITRGAGTDEEALDDIGEVVKTRLVELGLTEDEYAAFVEKKSQAQVPSERQQETLGGRAEAVGMTSEADSSGAKLKDLKRELDRGVDNLTNKRDRAGLTDEEYNQEVGELKKHLFEKYGVTETQLTDYERRLEAEQHAGGVPSENQGEGEQRKRGIHIEIPEKYRKMAVLVWGGVTRGVQRWLHNLDWRDKDLSWKIGVLAGSIESLAVTNTLPGPAGKWVKMGANWLIFQGIYGVKDFYFDRQRRKIEATSAPEELAAKISEYEATEKKACKYIKNFVSGVAAGVTYTSLLTGGVAIVRSVAENLQAEHLGVPSQVITNDVTSRSIEDPSDVGVRNAVTAGESSVVVETPASTVTPASVDVVAAPRVDVSGPRGTTPIEIAPAETIQETRPSVVEVVTSSEVKLPDFFNESVRIDKAGDYFWNKLQVDPKYFGSTLENGWVNLSNGVTQEDVIRDLIVKFARDNGQDLNVVHVGDVFKLRDLLTANQMEIIRKAMATKDASDYWDNIRPLFLAALKK